jgi:cyclomaltodextrinase
LAQGKRSSVKIVPFYVTVVAFMTQKESKKPPKLPEFVFGSLSTKEGRLKQARLSRLGFYHDSTLKPRDPTPNEAITIAVRVGAEVAVEEVWLNYTVDGTALSFPPDREDPSVTSTPMVRTGLTWDTLQWSYLEEWTAEIPGQPMGTQVQYVIQATTNQGRTIFSPFVDTSAGEFSQNRDDYDLKLLERLERENRPQVYGFVVDDQSIPAWLREAVIYQIFAERFAPDPGADFITPPDRSGFYGGTLKGITSKLDYLSDLGVTCLWLTPIFPSPSHHGYDPTDYGTIEPRLGTAEEFQTLVNEAKRRGMRILLDFVANHCSNRHPAFVAAQQDRTSPSFGWFRFTDWPKGYESYYDVPSQPKLNGDEPGVRTYLINNAKLWLERGVAGFRLDHAHGSTHAFWSAFRAATRAAKAGSITLGEITETPAFIRSYVGRMDGCLDFKLLELLRAFFAFDTLTVSKFDKTLQQHLAYFGSDLVLPSFLDNHDMNRFIWTVKGDSRRLRLAALCQFTLPGPPIIYYGTEVGLSQLRAVGRLEEARLPMPWGEEQDRWLLAFYKDLIRLRRETPEAWRLERETLIVDDEGGVYAYACGPYIVLFNNSPHETTIAVRRLAQSDGMDQPMVELALATDPAVVLRDQMHLPPFAGAVCERKN